MNKIHNHEVQECIDCTVLLEYTEANIDFTGIDQHWQDRFQYGWRKDGLVMVVTTLDNMVNYPAGYTQYDCKDGVTRKAEFYLP